MILMFSFLTLNKSFAIDWYATPYPSCQNYILEYRLMFYDPIYSTELVDTVKNDKTTFWKNLNKLFSTLDIRVPSAYDLKLAVDMDYLNYLCSLETEKQNEILKDIGDYVFNTEYARVELYLLYSVKNWDNLSEDMKKVLIYSFSEDNKKLLESEENIKSNRELVMKSLMKETSDSLKKSLVLYKKVFPWVVNK